MQQPSLYGFPSMKPAPAITPEYMNSTTYQINKGMIGVAMSQLIRNHTINKVEVEGSSLKNMFLAPLDFHDPKKPNEPPSQMRISYKHTPGVPAEPIGLRQLFDICEGYNKDANGKILNQKRLGFQCSGEIYVSKFNIGTKLSCKSHCTALTIFNFFESKFKDSQAEKHAYVDENVTLEEMNNEMTSSVLEILKGLATSTPTQAPAGNSFNPSGVDNGITNNLTQVGDNSLLNNIQTTPVVQETVNTTDFNGNTINVQQMQSTMVPVQTPVVQTPAPVQNTMQPPSPFSVNTMPAPFTSLPAFGNPMFQTNISSGIL